MRLVGAIVAVALIGGCSSDPSPASEPAAKAPASPPAWSEPAAYSYVLTRGCDEAAPVGRYQVKVSGGAVTSSDRLDAATVKPSGGADEDLGPVTGEGGEEIEAFTLAELLEMAQTTSDDGGKVTTSYDATDGHPVKVTLDVGLGPECWGVSDYKA